MEFRSEKTVGAVAALAVWLAPGAFAQYTYEAWHGHSRPPHIRKAGNMGTLTIGDSGVSFAEAYPRGKQPKHPHAWRWSYQDIQQLRIAPRSLTVLTYRDNRWKLGMDREYTFDLSGGRTFEDAYAMLRNRLDQRFVAAIPDRAAGLWEMPVKHQLRFGGTEGVLRAGADRIIYQSAKAGDSRTWRYEDIENISSSGPFQLTITTYERARTHYGDLKGFNFQLKQRLEEDRYNGLWLRLNRSKGLKVLQSYR